MSGDGTLSKPHIETQNKKGKSKRSIGSFLLSNSRRCISDPDQIAPATSLWTHRRDGAVNLRIEKEGPANAKPMSIPTLLVNTVKRNANGTAIGKGFVWSFSITF